MHVGVGTWGNWIRVLCVRQQEGNRRVTDHSEALQQLTLRARAPLATAPSDTAIRTNIVLEWN